MFPTNPRLLNSQPGLPTKSETGVHACSNTHPATHWPHAVAGQHIDVARKSYLVSQQPKRQSAAPSPWLTSLARNVARKSRDSATGEYDKV